MIHEGGVQRTDLWSVNGQSIYHLDVSFNATLQTTHTESSRTVCGMVNAFPFLQEAVSKAVLTTVKPKEEDVRRMRLDNNRRCLYCHGFVPIPVFKKRSPILPPAPYAPTACIIGQRCGHLELDRGEFPNRKRNYERIKIVENRKEERHWRNEFRDDR